MRQIIAEEDVESKEDVVPGQPINDVPTKLYFLEENDGNGNPGDEEFAMQHTDASKCDGYHKNNEPKGCRPRKLLELVEVSEDQRIEKEIGGAERK